MGIIEWLCLCAVITACLAGLCKVVNWLVKLLCGIIKSLSSNCLRRKKRHASGWFRAVQRWGKYKKTSTLWSIALILMVVLTIYLGSFALYTAEAQKSAVPGNHITEVTEPTASEKTPEEEKIQDPWKFGMDAVLYGIQTVQGILDGDASNLDTLPENLQWLGWLVSWLIPFLTASTAVMLLIGFMPKPMERKEEYLIFPQAEENSLLLAEDMMAVKGRKGHTRKDRLVIFLRVDEEKLTQEYKDRMQTIRARKYPYTEGDLLRIHRGLRKKKLRFFFLSANTEVNFSRMHTLLEEAEKDRLFKDSIFINKKRRATEEACGEFWQEMYLLSESESSPMLIDYLRKQMCKEKDDYERLPVFDHTELRLLDRYRTVMYDLMKEKPLYESADKVQNAYEMRILILGFGRVGKAFYRTAASFCPMLGYQTTFTIRDQNMDREWELLKLEYPECENVTVPNKDSMNVMSFAVEDLVRKAEEKNKPFTYIMLSLGEDERNIKVASRLARYYLKRRWEEQKNGKDLVLPTICVNLENNIRTEYVSEFFRDEKHDVQLHVFGTDNKTFSEGMLIDRKLWKAARMLHKGLKEEKDLNFAYWSEYERRSSIASAAHASWHVVSMKDKIGSYSYDEWYRNLGTAPKNAEIIEMLLCQEHRRWMNYSRCEGMRAVDVKTAREIIDGRRHHADPVAQLTPCLVDAKELNKLYRELYGDVEEENKKRQAEDKPPHRTFQERDHFVIANANLLERIVSEDGNEIELKRYDNLAKLKKAVTLPPAAN